MRVAELRGRGIDQEVVDLLHDRGINTLTAVQAAAVKAGLLDGASVVISAPTSAGKTLVGELLAARHAGEGVTVFLVSHRALARQLHGLLATRYVRDGVPFLRVGIATGDEDSVRGEWRRFDAIVCTYEKFYGACVAYPGLITALHAVVADELQIIGDPSRGHTAELVLAQLVAARKQRAVQIVGLSATVANGAELADWLGATHVNVTDRVPPLEYEVWTHGKRAVYSPVADAPRVLKSAVDPLSVKDAVAAAFGLGCEPLVVMATTKQKAVTFAELAAGNCPVDEGFPLSIVEDFRAHDETPAATKRIAALLQRRIGVHHADLTPEQRAVVEDAFAKRQLRLLCATTTLVAGVNLPIRAVLYPELTRWDRSRGTEVLITVEEFRNGTGRAGRLGYHDKGTAIVLAESRLLANAANRMITGDPAPIESRLDDRSVEWTLLHLLAARKAATVDALVDLAASTFLGHQQKLGEREDLRLGRAEKFRKVLSDDRWTPCWRKDGELINLTEAGREIARSGLEPSHVVETMAEVRRFCEGVNQGAPLERAKGEYVARVCLLDCMQDALPGPARKRVAWSYQCGYVSGQYGKVTITRGGTPQSSDPLGNHWTFTGRFLDEESGLLYYRARCYDPATGRFFQRDPLGHEEGTNLFEYVGSSPSNSKDPTGLQEFPQPPEWDELFPSPEEQERRRQAKERREKTLRRAAVCRWRSTPNRACPVTTIDIVITCNQQQGPMSKRALRDAAQLWVNNICKTVKCPDRCPFEVDKKETWTVTYSGGKNNRSHNSMTATVNVKKFCHTSEYYRPPDRWEEDYVSAMRLEPSPVPLVSLRGVSLGDVIDRQSWHLSMGSLGGAFVHTKN